MIKETKYNIGDIVWIVDNMKIFKTTIKDFNLTSKSEKYITDYSCIFYSVSDIFLTKEAAEKNIKIRETNEKITSLEIDINKAKKIIDDLKQAEYYSDSELEATVVVKAVIGYTTNSDTYYKTLSNITLKGRGLIDILIKAEKELIIDVKQKEIDELNKILEENNKEKK